MAGMAVKMAASKLGIPDATANEIEDLIEREPEKAVVLKQADKEFKDRIREMEIDLEAFKTEVEDRKDARKAFADDMTPKVFCILALFCIRRLRYGSYHYASRPKRRDHYLTRIGAIIRHFRHLCGLLLWRF